MLDPNGVNPKSRRAVVVTPDADLASGKPLVVIAIAGFQQNQPLSADAVPLPWSQPHGHPITKLVKRCAAFCAWLEQIDDLTRVSGAKGRVVEPYLSQIASKLAQLRNQIVPNTARASASSPPPPPLP